MAKRLKKKHQPMRFTEWMDSTGGTAFVYQSLAGDPERLEQIASLDKEDLDDGWKEAQRLGMEAMEKYHAYICLHIAHLLEKQ